MGNGGLFVMTFLIKMMHLLLAGSWVLQGLPTIEQVQVLGQCRQFE